MAPAPQIGTTFILLGMVGLPFGLLLFPGLAEYIDSRYKDVSWSIYAFFIYSLPFLALSALIHGLHSKLRHLLVLAYNLLFIETFVIMLYPFIWGGAKLRFLFASGICSAIALLVLGIQKSQSYQLGIR